MALHSPVKVTETGLRMCRPEKGRQIDAIRSGQSFSPVRFADEILRNTGIFAYFAAKGGAVSLRFRLAGGGERIRTLGTTLKPVRVDVRVSYTEPTTSIRESTDARGYPTSQTSAVFQANR